MDKEEAIDINRKSAHLFGTVLTGSVKNVIGYGIWTLVTIFVAKYSWWVGVILFAIYAIIAIITFLLYAFSAVIYPVMLFTDIYNRLVKGFSEGTALQLILHGAATAVQTVEQCIHALYLFFLYRVFFSHP